LIQFLDDTTAAVLRKQNLGRNPLAEEFIQEMWDQITLSIFGGRSSYSALKYNPAERTIVFPDQIKQIDLPVNNEQAAIAEKDILVQLAILNQSKRSLLRLLKQANGDIDLAEVDLTGVKLLPGDYKTISFSNAYVTGADVSRARLDVDSLRSLMESHIGRSELIRFGSILRVIRLSPQQQDELRDLKQ
jgi:hypothetical protein